MMKINPKNFQVTEGKKVQLAKWPTRIKPFFQSPQHYKELLEQNISELTQLQNIQYASCQHALLLIFQGMDGAGKDAAIKHVMSGINPEACNVFSFKQPSTAELKHDFLWRCMEHLPQRGEIAIFNRSYYEEVLIVRVHPELLSAQGFAQKAVNKNFWRERYKSIVDYEQHLYRNKTHIIKFFLHLSKEEQRKRLLARIDTPDKNWKINLDDIKERKYWKHYQQAYETCLNTTSTKNIPWHIIPADDKENSQLIISQIILDKFKALKLSYPKIDKARQQELSQIRKML
jgi:PPK2 family polyphosphate:nucleotide phosphotransferase